MPRLNTLVADIFKVIILVAALAAASAVAQAQAGKPPAEVKVVNTPAVTVVNTPTVEAKQVGPWAVGLDPALNTVKLDDAVPVKVRAADSPERLAFHKHLSEIILNSNSIDQELPFIEVPAGKRLVIEFVGVMIRLTPGKSAKAQIVTSVDGVYAYHPLVLHHQSDGPIKHTELYVGSQPLRLYADGGTQIHFFLGRSDAGDEWRAYRLSISGYLIDM